MNRKIFISYNHKDDAVALKIRDQLVAHQWEVLIDVESMQSGENIEQFIFNCIKESDITLTLISTNSLLSAWVAAETVATNMDEKLRKRRFIPCYIDNDFFERSFVDDAINKIDNNLLEIDESIKSRLERKVGFEDLQSERTRYLDLKANLPKIIGKLRDTLCIDLSGEHFESGMQKILNDLGKLPMAESIGALETNVQQTLDAIEKQRLTTVLNRIAKMQEMLGKYEEKLDVETDPKLEMKYEKEIENINNSIKKMLNEVQLTAK